MKCRESQTIIFRESFDNPSIVLRQNRWIHFDLKEMKTAISVLFAIFSAFALRFTIPQINAGEALSTSFSGKTQSPAVVKTAIVPRTSQTNDEFSPPFQV